MRESRSDGITVASNCGAVSMTSCEGVVPDGALARHGIEDGEQLAHAGGQGDELGFAATDELFIEGSDGRVVAAGAERCHIERGPHACSPAPTRAPPSPPPAVAVDR